MSEKPPEPPAANAQFEMVLKVLRQVLSGEPPEPGEPTGRAWVAGEADDGMTIVAVSVNDEVFHLKVPDLQSLAQIVGPKLKGRRAVEDIALPYHTKTGPSLPVVVHGVTKGASVSIMRAGEPAQAMTAIESISGDAFDVSCFTTRGPTFEKQGLEYKPINEDGVWARLFRGHAGDGLTEWALFGAFDQAGGEGSVEDRSGAASEAAALAFDAAAQRLQNHEPLETVLREAVTAANQAVLSLGVGAVSTLAVVYVETTWHDGQIASRRAVAATVGDSRVLWVGADGTLKGKTELHNLGSQVAQGRVPEIPPNLALRFAGALSRGLGTEDAQVDLYHWAIEPGDFLVCETDGIGDAHELEEAPVGQWHAEQCALAQAKILSQATSSAQAVEALLGYALDQMADRYGKPDNIGVSVLRVLS